MCPFDWNIGNWRSVQKQNYWCCFCLAIGVFICFRKGLLHYGLKNNRKEKNSPLSPKHTLNDMFIYSIKVTRFVVSWDKVTKNSHEVKCCPKNCITTNTLRKNIQKKIMILKQPQILSRLQKSSVSHSRFCRNSEEVPLISLTENQNFGCTVSLILMSVA